MPRNREKPAPTLWTELASSSTRRARKKADRQLDQINGGIAPDQNRVEAYENNDLIQSKEGKKDRDGLGLDSNRLNR